MELNQICEVLKIVPRDSWFIVLSLKNWSWLCQCWKNTVTLVQSLLIATLAVNFSEWGMGRRENIRGHDPKALGQISILLTCLFSCILAILKTRNRYSKLFKFDTDFQEAETLAA